MGDYVHWFARLLKWTPAELDACRVGDLDELWRDLLFPMLDEEG